MKRVSETIRHSAIKRTHAIILAGGSGTRLKSLTRWHAKPAVPFGGKFRTIDFPLSNCINSNIRKISILTQYKSHSLNTHIQKGWNFLRSELGEFIDLIPAQQRIKNSWYQGTADAVYQNLDILEHHNADYILVLAGDHIYKMDYLLMLDHHIQTGAEMTVGCIEVPLKDATELGVMSIDDQQWITEFCEKPANPKPMPGSPHLALASMGIYVFSRDFLYQKLREDADDIHSSHDFGKDIIPSSIGQHKISAFPFRDKQGKPAYWRDVGTVDAYYEANIELCGVTPPLDLYDRNWPIWTYQEQKPPAKFVFDDDDRRGMAVDSLVSSGCIVSGSLVRHSLLFNDARVHSYCTIEDSLLLPGAEVGRHCKLKKVILDRGVKLPPHTRIGFNLEEDAKRYYVSNEGVVLVSREMIDKEFNHVA